ncbi:dual specificity protein phosphatase 23, partial [Myiozetetes cayanensis]|uniref:dual specificity protein phosphatase 23 n=1 Tax=Myiozetetes cayanensis TaxID=478635 RepID=UPI002160B14F
RPPGGVVDSWVISQTLGDIPVPRGCCHPLPSLSPLPQAVAVHCALGLGRTGTLLGCYLGKLRGLSGVEAVREIRRLRPGSIETPEQEEAVIRFCDNLRAGKDPEDP